MLVDLAMVETFEMLCDVCIHAWPVEASEHVLFGFVDAIMPREKHAMGVIAVFLDEACLIKHNNTTRLKLPLDMVPNYSILNKTI